MADNSTSKIMPSVTVPSRRSIPPFAALRAFDAVARLGGIRKAAQVLSIDHAVVSRHLRALEAWTGIRLIERSQSGTLLTADGQKYHRAISGAIDDIAGATLDLIKQGESNQLQIWCMPGFAYQWLIPRIGLLEAENPALDVEVRPTDTPPDFGRHEADVDIRYAATYGPASQLPLNIRTLELSQPVVIPVASPGYLENAGPIRTAADFLNHHLLHEESFENWRAWLSRHGVENADPVSGPRLWHGHLTVDAARRGRGIALANAFLAAEDLKSGLLVEVGQGRFEAVSLGSYIFYARADRWTARPVARCRKWLTAAVARGTEA